MKNGDIVRRLDTWVTGVVTDSQPHERPSVGEVVGVQWDSGLGSNFGPQWTPTRIIRLEKKMVVCEICGQKEYTKSQQTDTWMCIDCFAKLNGE